MSVLELEPKPKVDSITALAPAKRFGSLRIRLRNTGEVPTYILIITVQTIVGQSQIGERLVISLVIGSESDNRGMKTIKNMS